MAPVDDSLDDHKNHGKVCICNCMTRSEVRNAVWVPWLAAVVGFIIGWFFLG